jgi:non-specific serine/threonine protein kinase
MLETIREFGLDLLEDGGRADDVRELHAAWFAGLVYRAWPVFMARVGQEEWLDRLEIEHDNIRAVLRWLERRGEHARLMSLARKLFWFWSNRGYLTEGRDWLSRLLGNVPDDRSGDRLRALIGAALMTHLQGDDEQAILLANESIARARPGDDPWALRFSLAVRGLIAEDSGDLDMAMVYLGEALEIARATGDRAAEGFLVGHVGIVNLGRGDTTQAWNDWEQALAIQREIADSQGIAHSLSGLGLLALENGDLAGAWSMQHESLERRWAQRNLEDISDSLMNVAMLEGACGNHARAVRLFAKAELMQDQVGSRSREPERSHYEQSLERSRSQLGAERFSAAWAAGRALTVQQAVEEALASNPVEETSRAEVMLDPVRPYDLTEREIEVLRLVADGLTDKEIGEALFISTRTVQTHVSHVLGKLGVSSRSAATNMALTQGLVESS